MYSGWSIGGEHYLCVFFTWVNRQDIVQKRLVGFIVADIPETVVEAEAFGFSAEDIGDLLNDVLNRFDRSYESIEFLSGDNTNVNPRLANLISDWLLRERDIERTVPLVGCAAHRLNLGVKTYYQHEDAIYYPHIKAVNNLMVNLMTLKNRAKLAMVTQKAPIRLHEIRWVGAHAMLHRQQEFETCIRAAALPIETRRLFISATMNEEINHFVQILDECNEISIRLQSIDPKTVLKLSQVRFLFDVLIRKYPPLEHDLKANSVHVHCPHFENGIVKIQNGEESKLLRAEADAVKIFLIEEDETEDASELSFVDSILFEAEKQAKKKSKISKYRSTLHVSATSCVCEQTNSQAKHIMRETRRHMDPTSLEKLLVLKLNSDLWDKRLVNTVIRRSEEELPNTTAIDPSAVDVSPSSFLSSLSSSSSSTRTSSSSSSQGWAKNNPTPLNPVIRLCNPFGF